jgi:hypothetical protein
MEPEWNAQARERLGTLGFPPPSEGWDAFEGWRADND